MDKITIISKSGFCKTCDTENLSSSRFFQIFARRLLHTVCNRRRQVCMIQVFLIIFSRALQAAHECSDAASEHSRAPCGTREKFIKKNRIIHTCLQRLRTLCKSPRAKISKNLEEDRFSVSHVLQKPDFELIAILSNFGGFLNLKSLYYYMLSSYLPI